MNDKAPPTGAHLCTEHHGDGHCYHSDDCDMCKMIVERDALLRRLNELVGPPPKSIQEIIDKQKIVNALLPAAPAPAPAPVAATLTPCEQLVLAAMASQTDRLGIPPDMHKYLNFWLYQMQRANDGRSKGLDGSVMGPGECRIAGVR